MPPNLHQPRTHSPSKPTAVLRSIRPAYRWTNTPPHSASFDRMKDTSTAPAAAPRSSPSPHALDTPNRQLLPCSLLSTRLPPLARPSLPTATSIASSHLADPPWFRWAEGGSSPSRPSRGRPLALPRPRFLVLSNPVTRTPARVLPCSQRICISVLLPHSPTPETNPLVLRTAIALAPHPPTEKSFRQSAHRPAEGPCVPVATRACTRPARLSSEPAIRPPNIRVYLRTSRPTTTLRPICACPPPVDRGRVSGGGAVHVADGDLSGLLGATGEVARLEGSVAREIDEARQSVSEVVAVGVEQGLRHVRFEEG